MNFEDLADQVLSIDGSKTRSDVLLDLNYTKSVEETLNRIFDGNFLQGIPKQSTSKTNEALVILDSDDDDEVQPSSPVLPNISIEEQSQTKDNIDYFDELSSTNDILDNEYTSKLTKDKGKGKAKESYISLDSLESLSPTITKNNTTDLPERAFSLDSIESLSPIIEHKSPEFDSLSIPPDSPAKDKDRYDFLEDDDEFSYTSKPQIDPFAFDDFENDKQSKKPSPKASSASASISESISLVDSDSEASLPSMDDFFDQLMSQKRSRPSTQEETVDRKGKRRAYEIETSPSPIPASQDIDFDDGISSLNTKERKKKESEEKKRMLAEKRSRVAEEKKRLREQKLEEQKRAKEAKALEKERALLREKENRLKNDRTAILKEIIIDMHPDFVKTTAGELLKSVLDRKEATTKLVEHRKHHISWRRIVKSEWDEDTLTFVPSGVSKIIKEPFILVYVDILEFVKHVKEETIAVYIDEIEATAEKHQIFLLVEGLETYYKKKRLIQKRQFDNQIRNSLTGGESTTTTTSKKKTNQEIENGPSCEEVEESINYLQLMRGIMFVFTKNDEDTASWLDSLTTDLALRRYKLRNANTSYKVGKAGADPSDNYFKMLQEIHLCTPAVAKSVMNTYPTLQSLYRAYERKEQTDGELLLANLEVERSAFHSRDRKINRVMSKKIYNVFNNTDPDQIIY